MEDLWAFNSVDLAYAISKSEIPVISAVGHESDFTICDFVSDLRAPTPSAAAELAVPNTLTIKNELSMRFSTIEKYVLSQIVLYRKQINQLASSRVLTSKEDLLNEYKLKISQQSDALDMGMINLIKTKSNSLAILSAKLNAISPLNTLSRGYSIVLDQHGKSVTSITGVYVGDPIEITFSNGRATANIERIYKTEDTKNA